jgi:hypothetical protein
MSGASGDDVQRALQGLQAGGVVAVPNQALEPTASSARYAPAFRRGCVLALGRYEWTGSHASHTDSLEDHPQ